MGMKPKSVIEIVRIINKELNSIDRGLTELFHKNLRDRGRSLTDIILYHLNVNNTTPLGYFNLKEGSMLSNNKRFTLDALLLLNWSSDWSSENVSAYRINAMARMAKEKGAKGTEHQTFWGHVYQYIAIL